MVSKIIILMLFKQLLLTVIILATCCRGICEQSEIPVGKASEEGMDEAKLLALAQWIEKEQRLAIYSLLISKNGKLVFELYTGQIKPDQSHYLMSVTKSVLSLLIGIFLDEDKKWTEDSSVAEMLPKRFFRNNNNKPRFEPISLKMVLGMSALLVDDPPRNMRSEAIEHQNKYLSARNRLEFVLQEPLLPEPGVNLLYNDETPTIASGILSYNTKLSAFDYGCKTLFKELEMKNMEWMHQDLVGINPGGYGLRLRPIDMQKIGLLILNNGKWHNKQVISEEWIQKIQSPYMGNNGFKEDVNNYGWYWWFYDYLKVASKLEESKRYPYMLAQGWKGQRIAVIPEEKLVVTMTGCIEKDKYDEFSVFDKILKLYILPAAKCYEGSNTLFDQFPPDQNLGEVLKKINKGQNRYSKDMEGRMIPSVTPKEKAVRFRP